MRAPQILVAVSALATAMGVGSAAQATSGFPDTIVAHLGLNYMPPCSVCHASASGGGPMAKPFGIALQQRGLSPGNDSSLETALDQLEADAVDSDGNGVTDIAQMRAGNDPNTGESLYGPEMTYGCVGTIARGSLQDDAWPTFAALLVGLFGLMSMRRRGPPRK